MSRADLPNWNIEPIESVLDAIIDYRGKSPPKSEKGVPLITAKNIRKGYIAEEPREYIFDDQYDSWMVRGIPKANDVFITTEAPLGNVALVPKYKFAIGQRVLALCPNKDYLLSEYLLQMMQGQDFRDELDLQSTGSTVAGIKQSTFRKITISLPPLLEQQKIASILSSVDDVIKKTTAQINKLKDLKTGMMQELLTKGIGHTEFIDSPVGRIPIGWDALTIRDLVKFIGGSQPPRDTFRFEEQVGYVRLLQIRDYKSDRYATYIPKELSRRWCSKSDIMIGRYGPPIFQILRGKEGSYNVALIKAEPLTADLLNGYLYHFLCRNDLFHLIDSYSQRTSGQTGIDMDALKDYGFPLPPIKEQEKIAIRLDHMDRVIELKESKLGSIVSTKKALMQDLLTGKVRVSVN